MENWNDNADAVTCGNHDDGCLPLTATWILYFWCFQYSCGRKEEQLRYLTWDKMQNYCVPSFQRSESDPTENWVEYFCRKGTCFVLIQPAKKTRIILRIDFFLRFSDARFHSFCFFQNETPLLNKSKPNWWTNAS